MRALYSPRRDRRRLLATQVSGPRRGLVLPPSRAQFARARTAPAATRAKVLGALSADGAMTAGDVAKATWLARGTVSTTLTKLAKTGEISKAERGYRLRAPR
jgi:CRP-like cAMP-binding protein